MNNHKKLSGNFNLVNSTTTSSGVVVRAGTSVEVLEKVEKSTLRKVKCAFYGVFYTAGSNLVQHY